MTTASVPFDLQRFFSLSRDMLCIAGFDGHFKLLSPAFHATLGYSDEELRAQPFIEFVHVDDRASTIAEAAKLSVGGVTISFENRYYAKDGSLRRLQWNATADLDLRLIYAVVRDVTAAYLDEQRYRSVIAAMAEGVAVHDVTGAIISWNKSAESILGLSGDQVAGRTSLDPRWNAVREDGQPFPGTEHPAMVTLRDGLPQNDVIMGIHKPDGTLTWISINTQPIGLAGASRADAVVASFKDITEQRHNEKSLRGNGARIRAVLDTVLDGIITIDASGIIESFNPAAEGIFEYRAAEVIGRNVNLLMPDPYHSAHDGYLERYVRAGEKRIIGLGREVVGRKKSGATFPMDLAISEMQVESQRLFVGVLRDITERKKLEQLQKQFISNVSHELRTPLNAILGFTQLLTYDAQLTDEHKASLGKISKAGEHLLALINDVLDLSRMESGNLSLTLEPVKVDLLLRECFQLIQPLADARSVRVQIQPASMANIHVVADRTRLRQVLLNLLSNAVKYHHAGGVVDVECTRLASGRARISVRDNGPGIAADKQRELFQPFNRLGAEHSPVEGTGIGLTISRELTALMGGTLAYRSIVGEGSTFWLDLNLTHPAPAAQPQLHRHAATLRSGAGKYRVLYIEDNPANMELVRALFAQFWPQTQFLAATSAEVGLDLAAAQRPHLILMDINLPGMDGYAALACLQNNPLLRKIPVVAITANATAENIAQGRAAGFIDYLTKPIAISRFMLTVDALLSSTDGAPSGPSATTRILLVDDDRVNCEVARSLLEALGYGVDVVGNGRAAIEAMQQSRYAAILMDYQMPEMDGYATTTAIRAAEGNAGHIPIVAVTAHAIDHDAAQRGAAGMDDYVAKPIQPEALRACLARWVAAPEAATPRESLSLSTTAGVLDPRMTGQLQELLGARVVPIVDSLLGDLPRRLRIMRTAMGCNDVLSVRHEAHTMKGSSSNLGAIDFAALCSRISELCKTDQWARVPGACAALEDEFNMRVKPALLEYRAALLAGEAPSEHPNAVSEACINDYRK